MWNSTRHCFKTFYYKPEIATPIYKSGPQKDKNEARKQARMLERKWRKQESREARNQEMKRASKQEKE